VIATEISFRVEVVDGDCIPVPGLEIGARYHYPSAAGTWSTAVTDGDGCATFGDAHPEPPESVCLYVDGDPCLTTQSVEDGHTYVLEI
jgi:hypothetical protein